MGLIHALVVVAVAGVVVLVGIEFAFRIKRAKRMQEHNPAIGQHRRNRHAPPPWRKLAEDAETQRRVVDSYGKHAARPGVHPEYDVFWDDLAEDMKDPKFARAYTSAHTKVASAFNNPW